MACRHGGRNTVDAQRLGRREGKEDRGVREEAIGGKGGRGAALRREELAVSHGRPVTRRTSSARSSCARRRHTSARAEERDSEGTKGRWCESVVSGRGWGEGDIDKGEATEGG